jgi:potassium efflux system protein
MSPLRPRLVTLACAAALLAAVAGPAAAQPASSAVLSAESIKDRIAAVEARRDLDEPTRKRVADTYRQAIAELERAASLRTENDAAARRAAETPAEIRRLERLLEQSQKIPVAVPESDAELAKLPTPQLEQRDTAAREAALEARRDAEDAERAADEGAGATVGLRGRQERIRATLDVLRGDLTAAAPAGQPTALAEARRQQVRARNAALQAELELIETQLAAQPGAQRVLELRRDVARQYGERSDSNRRRVLAVLEQRRAEEADRARAAAADADKRYADQPTVVRALAATNAQLAAEVAETAVALDRTLLEVSRLRSATSDLDASLRLMERRAEARTLGREFAQALLDRLRRLPKPEDFARSREERERLLAQANDANVRSERALEQLGTVEAATVRVLQAAGPLPEAERARTEALVRDEVSRQRVLLVRLDEQQDALVRALADVEEAEHELVTRTRAAQDRLLQLLFWVPLNPINAQTFANLEPALAWNLSPANWRDAGDALAREARRHALVTALLALAVAALYATRGRLKRRLEALSPDEMPRGDYRITHLLAALAITLALALPFALVLGGASWLLLKAPGPSPFITSMGIALKAAAQLYVTLYGFSWLFDRRGVAIRHFHWHAETMRGLQSALRRFTAFFVPLVFVVTLNGAAAPQGNSESLGRIAFLIAMGWIAVFVHRIFRREAPLMQRLFGVNARSWLAKLHPGWFAFVVLLPVAIGVLAASGFYFAAGFLFQRTMNMLLLGLAALMVYGGISLWVVMQRSRLYRRQAEASAEEPAAPVEIGAPRPEAIDIAAIGEQARQLLNLLVTVLVLVGLWLIWKDALPALKVVGDFALWTYVETVDGEQITRPLTLGGLAVAILVGVVTAVTVKNIGALLDIVLLQRLELQADATYAIKTVTRYAIAGIGIFVATGLIGVSWSKLQWLVAALGVGLGFGLQEIVANFVSGLIVLAERPIRIGDVVTVGDVSGTVSRIRARATSVVDFDNKEVLIPNKAFITERVVNWTLSSQVTRLLLKVGVAYGTDIEAAQRIMYQAVRAHPDVLVEPPYSVFFVGFGDSALNFEIRAYVDSIDKRLRVTHALNVAIERALREAGIGIPFPQREVILRAAPGTTLPPLAASDG